MIRCTISTPSHLIPRWPCPIHRGDKRNTTIARAVIARDKKCWKCGSTDRLESGHIIPKRDGGRDTMANQRAECFSLNRTGRCKA